MPIDVGPRAAVHLLNRIGYGPRPGDVARILGMGLDRYVQGQLDAPADPELDSRLRGLVTLAELRKTRRLQEIGAADVA